MAAGTSELVPVVPTFPRSHSFSLLVCLLDGRLPL